MLYYCKASILSRTASNISLYLTPFALSSLTTASGALLTNLSLESFFSTLKISPSSLVFSLFNLSNSFSLSTKSSNGKNNSPPLTTTDTKLLSKLSLLSKKVTSDADASFSN